MVYFIQYLGYSVIEGSFTIKNVGTGILTGNLINSDSSIKLLNDGSFSLEENKSSEIKFSISCLDLPVGAYTKKLMIESSDEDLEVLFIWTIIPNLPALSPASIKTEKVIKGSIVERTVQITKIEGNQIIKVSSKNQWIGIQNNSISAEKDLDIKFSIDTKVLPEGSYKGEILFIFLYQSSEIDSIELGSLKLPVEFEVVSDKIIIEIWIGKNSAFVNNISCQIDKNNPSVVPIINKGATMLPLRFTGENLGAEIVWNNSEQSIKLSFLKKNLIIFLIVNNKEALINGKKLTLTSPPIIINGRVFVPIRFISESIGAEVKWEAKQQKITIISTNYK